MAKVDLIHVPASAAGRAAVERLRRALAERPRAASDDLAGRRAALDAMGARHPPGERLRLRGVEAELHGPRDAGVAVVHVHGGAYVIGSATSHRGLAARLAAAAAAPVYAVDYRRAPEHPFPAGRDDVVAAVLALQERGLGVALSGDSAGGGLAIQAACALRDLGAPGLKTIVCTSPWVDLALGGPNVPAKAALEAMLSLEGLRADARRYAGRRSVESVSPLALDLHELPPTLIQVGDCELLYDDAIRLADRLAQADVRTTLEVWEGMVHSWHAFEDIPEAGAAVRRWGAHLHAARA